MNAAMARWQDWVAVVIGVVVALSPLWMDTNDAARWSMIVLGVLVAVAGLAHMMSAEMAMVPWALGVLGVLMFISPWVMDFAAMEGAAWTMWIGGVLTAVVAVAELAEGNRMHIGHRGGLAPHH